MSAQSAIIIVAVCSLFEVLLTTWVAWKVKVVAHQTNSMQEEMQRLAKAEGKAEGRAEQREESR